MRRVLALEAEAAELRREVAALREEHRRAIEEVRRSVRREIVPLNQSLSLYRGTTRRGR